jgi:hypothetical protein
LDLYSASDYLPKTLVDPVKGPSYDVAQTAFQDAVGTEKPRWEWLEEKIHAHQDTFERQGYPRGAHRTLENEATGAKIGTKARPEQEIFGRAMVGGGRVFGTAHIYGLSIPL